MSEHGTALRQIAAVSMSCVLGLCLAPGVASAQGSPADAELAPTMVVLDASGSMTGADPAGGTKMDAARRAVHALLDSAPEGASIGLEVYGTGTGSSDAEKAQGCQDVTVLEPPGPLDRAHLGGVVDGLTPRGYTPIGRSLEVAAQQLPQEGPRSIVLVSDGVDTCAPPEPCEVVRTLAGQGVDLVVHTVGFGVDDAARAQLSCVAQTTGGTYTDAPDADALQRVLPRVTRSALRNYQPAGTPVTGSAAVQTAPVVAPGQHLDTIGQHAPRYYSMDVPDGATAYLSATVAYPRIAGIGVTDDMNVVRTKVYGADGQDCHQDDQELVTFSSSGTVLTVTSVWQGATEGRTGDAEGDRCRGGGRYTFEINWDVVSRGVPERLPVELLAIVEPPVDDQGPVATLPDPVFVQPAGPAVPVAGGGSFNVAAELPGSGSYTDVVQRGEFVFYKVRLDWGQGLAYRVRMGAAAGYDGADSVNIATSAYTPSRREIVSDSLAYVGDEETLPGDGTAETTARVRYGNRTSDTAEYQPQGLAGDHYIAVHVGEALTDHDTGTPVPIRLDVTVDGAAEPGPRYAAPAVPSPTGGQSQAAPQGAVATHTVVSPLGWAVIGGLAVLAVVFAVVLVRRAGRSTDLGNS